MKENCTNCDHRINKWCEVWEKNTEANNYCKYFFEKVDNYNCKGCGISSTEATMIGKLCKECANDTYID